MINKKTTHIFAATLLLSTISASAMDQVVSVAKNVVTPKNIGIACAGFVGTGLGAGVGRWASSMFQKEDEVKKMMQEMHEGLSNLAAREVSGDFDRATPVQNALNLLADYKEQRTSKGGIFADMKRLLSFVTTMDKRLKQLELNQKRQIKGNTNLLEIVENLNGSSSKTKSVTFGKRKKNSGKKPDQVLAMEVVGLKSSVNILIQNRKTMEFRVKRLEKNYQTMLNNGLKNLILKLVCDDPEFKKNLVGALTDEQMDELT